MDENGKLCGTFVVCCISHPLCAYRHRKLHSAVNAKGIAVVQEMLIDTPTNMNDDVIYVYTTCIYTSIELSRHVSINISPHSIEAATAKTISCLGSRVSVPSLSKLFASIASAAWLAICLSVFVSVCPSFCMSLCARLSLSLSIVCLPYTNWLDPEMSRKFSKQ